MLHNEYYNIQYIPPNGNARADTAIIIKNTIKHHISAPVNEEHLQGTSIVAEGWFGPPTAPAVYKPSRYKLITEMYKRFCHQLGHSFIEFLKVTIPQCIRLNKAVSELYLLVHSTDELA